MDQYNLPGYQILFDNGDLFNRWKNYKLVITNDGLYFYNEKSKIKRTYYFADRFNIDYIEQQYINKKYGKKYAFRIDFDIFLDGLFYVDTFELAKKIGSEIDTAIKVYNKRLEEIEDESKELL